MSRGHLQGFAEQGGHTVVVSGNNSTTKFQESYPGCTVTVFLAGTTTAATIYSDMAGTSKSNPFTSDATTAYWDFYAESTARYDVKFEWGDGAHSDVHGGWLLPGVMRWMFSAK